MSSFGILEAVGILGIAYYVVPEPVNQLFNVLVPAYTILSIIVIASFIRLSKSDSSQKSDRIYNVPKKLKPGVELTWKQKFAGTWDKHEREGFPEFVAFMGIMSPSMVKIMAKTIESQPFQNIITYKDESEREIKIDSKGKPEMAGVWVEVGTDEKTAAPSEVEVDKEKVLERIWWDEETHIMHRTREFTKSGRQVVQTRQVTDDDKLVLVNKFTKADGTSNVFKVVFKRIPA